MTGISEKLLQFFEQINSIPRCSKNEKHLGRWLHEWALARGFATRSDSAGNLVVRLPAAPGQESRPGVVLQGHMDMVCEKTPDSAHDFSKDPIRSHRQGDWLQADGTTLGADNGIAIAYALAVAEETRIQRPPMELLFTVDEETGLNGVKALGPDMIGGRILINLDSEEEGVFTIGCAGGMDTAVDLEMQTEPVSKDYRGLKIIVGGIKGGHSGIEIHKPHANAIKVLARTLARVNQAGDARLARMSGGTRHNAIARDAEALIVIGPQWHRAVEEAVGATLHQLRNEYTESEPDLQIKVEPYTGPAIDRSLTPSDTARSIRLLKGVPHGVAYFSAKIDGLVETSCNLAVARLQEGQLQILSSQRSSVASRLEEINATVQAVAELAGAVCRHDNKYPPWQPEMSSPLLHRSIEVYRGLFGKDPKVQVIHAGLECAIIGAISPGMQMISFGPTIRHAHSPQERLHIPSVEQVWLLLAGLLEHL